MSLATFCSESGVQALAGINSSSKASVNEHFRIFDVQKDGVISLGSKHSVFSAPDSETYQRVVRVDPSGEVAVIASGSGLAPTSGSEVVVLDIPSLGVRRRIRLPGKEEASEVDISGNGDRITFCSSGGIYLTSTKKNGKSSDVPPALKTPAMPKGSFRSVRFTDEGHIIAAFNLAGRSGVIVHHIDASGRLLASRKLHNGIKAATGMDCISLSPTASLVAIAGADQSVELVLVERGIKSVKTFKNAHPFQITRLAFSPLPDSSSGAEIKLASTSMGNTVVVFSVPIVSAGKNGWILRHTSMKQTAFWAVISLIGVVIFAIALQVMFNARAGLPEEEGGHGGKMERLSRKGLEDVAEVAREVVGGAKQVGVGVVKGMLGEAVQAAVG